jgi:hypothetical protein
MMHMTFPLKIVNIAQCRGIIAEKGSSGNVK